jgi:hypothetical protein
MPRDNPLSFWLIFHRLLYSKDIHYIDERQAGGFANIAHIPDLGSGDFGLNSLTGGPIQESLFPEERYIPSLDLPMEEVLESKKRGAVQLGEEMDLWKVDISCHT